MSKAVSLPGGLPDLIGLTWRKPRHRVAATPWDVLMVSAGSGRLTRSALRPTLSWTGTTLSTVMPSQRADGAWRVTARMTTALGPGLSLRTVRDAIDEDGGVVFDVDPAHGSGPLRPLAQITLTATISTDDEHDVSFDPTRNTTDGVSFGPPWLTVMRERAYLRSRRGRRAPEEPAS